MNPEGVHFVTQHGKDEQNGDGLAIRVCQNGVSIYSEKDIQLASSGSLELRSDQRLTMNAAETMEFVCKASNLKLDGLIWRKSTKVHENRTRGLGNSNQRQGEKEKRNHAASPTPTPAVNTGKMDEDKNKEDKQEEMDDKKYYLGADGKKNYLDASRLYQCELNAYNNPKFNPTYDSKGNRQTYPYIGERRLFCGLVITTSAMRAGAPKHIAVICPQGVAAKAQNILLTTVG